MSDKSDRLDAKVLCQNALFGTWPASFVVSDDIHVIRTLFLQRDHCERKAIQIGNSINSELLRYGVNIGREGSVTLNTEVRKHVMDQLSDDPQLEPGRTIDMIPPEVKVVLKNSYEEWDALKAKSNDFLNQIRSKIYSINWKCGDKEVDGKTMIDLLQTVPGVGEVTSFVWLSTVICAHRFETYLKCAAYCGYDPSNATSAGKTVRGKKRKGNLNIHSKLSQCAGLLINQASEPFGRWGAQVYQRTGSFSKARSALGRKLCIALYYVQKRGEKFQYDSYRIEEPTVLDIPLEELVMIDHRFKRYVKIMIPLGIETTQMMIHWYQLCKFKRVKGLGKNFYALIREFIDTQSNYEEKYESLFGVKNQELLDDEERIDFNE